MVKSQFIYNIFRTLTSTFMIFHFTQYRESAVLVFVVPNWSLYYHFLVQFWAYLTKVHAWNSLGGFDCVYMCYSYDKYKINLENFTKILCMFQTVYVYEISKNRIFSTIMDLLFVTNTTCIYYIKYLGDFWNLV